MFFKCCMSVCLSVYLDVNQGGPNCNRCTQRLVILHAQTHWWTLIAHQNLEDHFATVCLSKCLRYRPLMTQLCTISLLKSRPLITVFFYLLPPQRPLHQILRGIGIFIFWFYYSFVVFYLVYYRYVSSVSNFRFHMRCIPTLHTFILNSFSHYLLIFIAVCY